jgi:hypothetical protein
MTREDGLHQIETAEWEKDDCGCLNIYLADKEGMPVHAWLTPRPNYCDRGHVQLNIDGFGLALDSQDSFPRYFFSFEEADRHTRTFLKWRMWKERTVPYAEIRKAFGETEE